MAVYLSGPMSGYPGLNYDAFHTAEKIINQSDPTIEVINPASVDLGEHGSWEAYMRHHIEVIVRDVHAIVTLPGFECSRGAALEVYLAHQLGIPVMPLATWMQAGRPNAQPKQVPVS